MRSTFIVLLFFCQLMVYGQHAPADYGYRHLQTIYGGDTVEILVRSKKGEELQRKPVFLFCQGSLPIPLLVRYGPDEQKSSYPVFVFNPDSLSREYHLVIVGKPSIPLMAHTDQLRPDLTYADSSGNFSREYVERNLLDYYVKRNIAVLEFLRKQSWVKRDQLVVAGHSEGSAVAAKLASDYPAVTALIYSGGNPLGRMMSLLSRTRAAQNDTAQLDQGIFQYWQNVTAAPGNMDGTGDTFKSMYQFSYPPPMDYLKKIRIPVLITFGTKDYGAVNGIDYFRMEMIRLKKDNFTFREYSNTEHNFFPVKESGEVDYDRFNWDKVAEDWRAWLNNGRR